MATSTSPPIALPRQRGPVTVRTGGLDEDLDALHAGDPLWWGKAWVAERVASMPPERPLLMLVAELDGRPVADAFLIAVGAAQRGYAIGGVYVLPAARRNGVGRVVVEALVEATAEHGLPGLSDVVHETDEASLAAAGRLGFEVMGHHRESLLDLDALDLTAARASVVRAETAGFDLRPMPDDAMDADWRQLYDITISTWRDAPDAEGSQEDIPYSVFRGFLTDSSYVLTAWKDGELVGMTGVMDRTKDRALNTFFTGVLPGARGLGVATALKAQHALSMRARGHHAIYTQNMAENAPLLAANDRLGFTVVPGFFSVGRPVEAGSGT